MMMIDDDGLVEKADADCQKLTARSIQPLDGGGRKMANECRLEADPSLGLYKLPIVKLMIDYITPVKFNDIRSAEWRQIALEP